MPINPDKIKELEKPFYTPGVDIYDKDHEGPVIQLGVTLTRFSGDLYMKSAHLEFIAREHLGMVSREDHDKALRELREAYENNVALTAERDQLKEELSGNFNQRIDSLIADYASSRGINGSNPPVANAGAGNTETETKASSKGKAKNVSFDEL